MANVRTILGVVLLISINIGCVADINERHYFKSSKDTNGVPNNFYEVSVRGFTFGSSARYLAGYFDEKAVDSYFSEFAQPEKGKLPATGVEPLDPNLKGRQLILILSSNSDEVATQIGALSDNERLGRALNRMINKDKFLTARQLDQDAKLLTSRQKDLVAKGKSWITDLDSNATQQTAQDNTLQYLNDIAAVLGNTVPFKDEKDAKTWLNFNRNKILNE